MKHPSAITRSVSVLVVLGWGPSSSMAAVGPKETDDNRDGRTDMWTWSADGVTTYVIDRNYDGRPDEMDVYETQNEKGDMRGWKDLDYDGAYDDLLVRIPAIQGFERWVRTSSQPPKFGYVRRDVKNRILTVGVTFSLGSRVFESVTTSTIPDIERRGKYWWTNHKEGISVEKHQEGPKVDVKLWGDGWDANMVFPDVKTSSPETVPETFWLREWDPPNSFPLRIKTYVVIHYQTSDQRLSYVYLEQRVNDSSETIKGEDTNRDGSLDRFRHGFPNGRILTQTDRDFDGQLDEVETREPDGATIRLVGDQIPDRKIPNVSDIPLPQERIKDLLKRARAALMAP